MSQTRLYRIRRRNDAELRYLFIKAESYELAAERFAGIAGLEVIETTLMDQFEPWHVEATLSNGTAISVVESKLDAITKCHPVLVADGSAD